MDKDYFVEKYLISKQYAFHMTSIKNLFSIVGSGYLFPRDIISKYVENDLANDILIQKRKATSLPNGKPVTSAVPFYFNPRQPMFNRLLKEDKIKCSELCAICVDIETLKKNENYLYCTNPIYENSKCIGGLDNINELDWEVLTSWSWNSNNLPDNELIAISQKRQAEVLVCSKISIDLINCIITDKTTIENININVLIMETIFSDIIEQKIFNN